MKAVYFLTAFARITRIRNLVLLILALSLSLRAQSTFDWPQWRGPNRNGVSAETEWLTVWPKEGPKVQWKAAVGTGFAGVAVSNGRVFTLGNTNNEDTVYCLNAETGEVVWKHTYPCALLANSHPGGPCTTPTVDGDAVYTYSKQGHVFCLNAADGKVRWSKELPKDFGVKPPQWAFAGSPLVTDKFVILNAGYAGVALNKTNGELGWKSEDKPGFGKGGGAGYSSPVPYTIGNQKCAAIFSFNEMHGVNVETGALIWKYPWATSFGENSPDPLVAGDQIFISSGHGLGSVLLKMDGENITQIWKNEKFGNHIASSVFLDGYLYGFDGRIHRDPCSLNCVDFKTGEIKWTQPALKGQLLLAGKTLLILTADGILLTAEANPKEYKELSRAQVFGGKSWGPPVLCNGRVFCRNAQGELLCVDLRK